jgi:hypothetical protein
MRHYKKYALIFITFTALFILFHAIVWNVYTKHVFPENYMVGDLGRMSYKLNSLHPRKTTSTLHKKHFALSEWDGQSFDILTIGDSFSNGGGSGLNSYYQDHLASEYNLSILNIQNIPPATNFLETIYLLNNAKVLDKLRPKIIIFESTESQTLNRFALDINNRLSLSPQEAFNLLKHTTYKSGIPQMSVINNLNYNAVLYNIAYNFSDNALNSNCYVVALNKGVFSTKDQNSLLFYKHTIKYNKSINQEKINILNKNINDLAKVLKSKGIQLYFMPAVDKFNLYSKYIINNKYGKNEFFEQLRELPKEYKLIDTKAILQKKIDEGEKDIFYADDTHWSYKASDAIAKSLKELGELNNGKL